MNKEIIIQALDHDLDWSFSRHLGKDKYGNIDWNLTDVTDKCKMFLVEKMVNKENSLNLIKKALNELELKEKNEK